MAIQLTNSFQKVAEVSSQVTSNTTGYTRLYLRYDDRDINTIQDTIYYEIRQYSYNPYGNYLGWGNPSSVPWHIKSTNGKVYASGTYTQPNIYSNSGEVLRTSGKFVVTHKEDGSWSDTINFSAYVYTASLNINAEISLPNIDRLATITNCPTSLTDEDTTITFSYSNPANFKVKVYAMVTQESANGFAYDEYLTGSPFTWEWLSSNEDKEKLYNIVRNSPNATVSLRLQTYNNNDELLGITAVNIPLTIVNADPFVELEVEEINQKVRAIVGEEPIAVNYVSQLKSTATFIGSKGATLKKISINNVNGNTSPFEVIVNVTSENSSTIFGVVASVEDSRTLTDGAEKIYQLIDYRPVKINSYKFKRENPTSDQIYLTANITYWNVIVNNVNNTPKLSYSTDGNTYVTIPASEYTIDDSNKSITLNNYAVPTKLNYKNQGTYYLKVEDNFTDDGENEIVTKGIPTTEKGEHDFQVNGDLFIADEDRQNKVNVLPYIDLKSKENAENVISENVKIFGKTSANLFNPAKVAQGLIVVDNIQTINTLSTFAFSGFIPVKPNTTYTRSATGDTLTIFMSQYKGWFGSTNSLTFTTPDDCYFVGFNIDMSNINNGAYLTYMMNEGSKLLDYIPYIEPQISIKDSQNIEHTFKLEEFKNEDSFICGSIYDFQAYLKTDAVPAFTAMLYHLSLNGLGASAFVHKTSNIYQSFLYISYSGSAVHYKCLNGVWSSANLY